MIILLRCRKVSVSRSAHLVYKKVYTVIENLLRPLDDPSQIDHDLLIDVVIRTFEEYGSAKVRVLRVGAPGSAAPHPGCMGYPEHCHHSNGTWAPSDS